MNHTHDMTTGNPTKSILLFALPLIAGYLLQQMYVVADAAIVGHWIGVNALAAIGASFAVMFLIMGFCNGSCAGFAIPVAQAFGAKDYTTMRRYTACAIRMSAIIALTISTVTVLLCRPILRWLSTPDDIIPDAYTFLLLQFLGIPFTMAYNLLASLLRALGNSRQPFYFLILTSILNILLAIILIIGFHRGVEGVGIATMTAQGISALACWFYIKHRTPILVPHGEEWKTRRHENRHLLANGIPMGLQFSITAIGIIMLQAANNALGTACVAAFTAAMRVKYLFTCVFENIGVAMATYCGQNIGAGQISRVKKGLTSALSISFVYFLITVILIMPWADEMMLLFVDTSHPGIIADAARLMRISCWFYPALGILTVLRYSIQGLGYSALSMLSGVMEMFARGGVSIWLVPAFHFTGVCFGDPTAWVCADMFLVPAIFWLLQKKINSRQPTAKTKEQEPTVRATN